MSIIAKDLMRSCVEQRDFQSGVQALYDSERSTRDGLEIKHSVPKQW